MTPDAKRFPIGLAVLFIQFSVFPSRTFGNKIPKKNVSEGFSVYLFPMLACVHISLVD
jgi:hypothetical protein